MENEESKSPDSRTEPFKFYRKLHPSEEAMIEGLLNQHPGLTKEVALEMLEAAGF